MAQRPQKLARKAPMVGLSLFVSMVTTGLCAGERPPPEAACPVYDLHLVTLVEDHGTVADINPEVLRAATLRMIDARLACRTGDIERALQIYDSITLGHVPMSPFYRVTMH